ncbi:acetolactate synthase large subunit [Bradyrhizobium liaoningense]|uniref:acetolactate synthase large subunit n=1 Tax=Bradyrhizobium liaoningense TaxID=43992 RepID=UPI001BADF0CB|nr:acetolactate synthase large subunit [Bradyrhizobium liaoningense]
MADIMTNTDSPWTGAEALLRAAHSAGIDVCFANPGTTEIPLVRALDNVPEMRPVLALFEGVCSGAADGYGRMRATPALTLTHLGPGFANSIANLHNARRARTPIVNIIGDHASWHLPFDAPLTSDISSLAASVSGWQRKIERADDTTRDAKAAIAASMQRGGQVATLVFPMDFQQQLVSRHRQESLGHSHSDAGKLPLASRDRIEDIARCLHGRPSVTLLLGGSALTERGQHAAAAIAQYLGAKLYAETFPARIERGRHLPDVDRLPYFPEPAIKALAASRHVILVGSREPIAYFGYENVPSRLAPDGSVMTLAEPGEDSVEALEALSALLGVKLVAFQNTNPAGAVPEGRLSPQSIGSILAQALPENAIVSIEGGTCGYPFATASAISSRCTLLTNTGGAIGQGLPVAIGAAIACPDRKVIALQSDGSAQYTIQSLWTMVRESLPIVVLIASNHRYGVLQTELARSNVSDFGPASAALTSLDKPGIDWLALARGYGVPAVQVTETATLRSALSSAIGAEGPQLIEMSL